MSRFFHDHVLPWLIGLPAGILLSLFLFMDDVVYSMHDFISSTPASEIKAWRCSAVTDQNWYDPVWDESDLDGDHIASRTICEMEIGKNLDSTPCTFGGLAFYCHRNMDGVMTVRQHDSPNIIYLNTARQKYVGDALVILYPTTEDPRSQ